MAQTAQYDHIGSKYDEYARTATLKRAESYTFFRMVGELAGQRVLDLACGFGFYTRQLKRRGAVQVVGVDISPEMVRLARAKEQEDPTGVEYRVGDAIHLPLLGPFDLVTAVYLLNYAESKDQMLGMCRSAYDNLVAGGRFVAYTVNPWSQATYEWAMKETGFRAFAWHASEVAPEDIAHYGEVYWRDFHDNCLVIGLVCQK